MLFTWKCLFPGIVCIASTINCAQIVEKTAKNIKVKAGITKPDTLKICGVGIKPGPKIPLINKVTPPANPLRIMNY